MSHETGPRHPDLRAGDADREITVERLREAYAEGRLRADELEDRTARAYRAVTMADLAPLVADLPGPRRHVPAPAAPVPAPTWRHRHHAVPVPALVLLLVVALALPGPPVLLPLVLLLWMGSRCRGWAGNPHTAAYAMDRGEPVSRSPVARSPF